VKYSIKTFIKIPQLVIKDKIDFDTKVRVASITWSLSVSKFGNW